MGLTVYDPNEKASMRHYTTLNLALLALIVCFILTIGNILFAILMKPSNSSRYLHEHKQLIDDWTTQPFVDIVLEPEECPIGYEPLLYRVWNGTYDIC